MQGTFGDVLSAGPEKVNNIQVRPHVHHDFQFRHEGLQSQHVALRSHHFHSHSGNGLWRDDSYSVALDHASESSGAQLFAYVDALGLLGHSAARSDEFHYNRTELEAFSRELPLSVVRQQLGLLVHGQIGVDALRIALIEHVELMSVEEFFAFLREKRHRFANS